MIQFCECVWFQPCGNFTKSRDDFTDHYDDVIMTMLASQITSLTVVYSIVYSGVNQRKHQSSASLAFVREIHRGPVNFPHKWPVTRKMFPFDDVIMWFSFANAFDCTVRPVYNDHLTGYLSAFWSSSRLPRAGIVSKSKLVPSVCIETHHWIIINHM